MQSAPFVPSVLLTISLARHKIVVLIRSAVILMQVCHNQLEMGLWFRAKPPCHGYSVPLSIQGLR